MTYFHVSQKQNSARYPAFCQSLCTKTRCKPRDVKLSEQKQVWGTCDKDGTIRINWYLIHAPLAVLEYVVAHELVHLLHRHHGDTFWETLEPFMTS